MAVINIDDAYILNETGAQVDKVTGLYFKDESTSAAEKAFAQLNIGTAGSNRNLLDNPWFTVNQRGVNGTIANGQYGLDRWMAGGGTVTMATGGITLGAGNSYALQRPANKEIFNGKTVTMSVMTDDGVIESGTVVAQTGAAKAVRTANFELCIGYTAYGSFYFYNTSSSVKTVIAAKLELGSVSTLANDVPPDYGEELAKCQRYFLRIYGDPIGTGYIASGLGTVFILVPTGVTMRAKPTVSYSGAFSVRVQGSTISVSAMTFATPAHTGGGVGIVCTLSSNAGSVGTCAMYPNQATAYIDLSADL